MTKKAASKAKNQTLKSKSKSSSAKKSRRGFSTAWVWPVSLIIIAAIIYLLYAFGVDFYQHHQEVQKRQQALELYHRG